MDFTLNMDDPVYMMRYQFNEMLLSIKREKYTIILDFLNDIFNKKYTTLKTYTNIYMNFTCSDKFKLTKVHNPV